MQTTEYFDGTPILGTQVVTLPAIGAGAARLFVAKSVSLDEPTKEVISYDQDGHPKFAYSVNELRRISLTLVADSAPNHEKPERNEEFDLIPTGSAESVTWTITKVGLAASTHEMVTYSVEAREVIN